MQTDQKNNRYPAGRAFACFVLCGGALGGVLVLLGFGLTAVAAKLADGSFNGEDWQVVAGMPLMSPVFMLFGTVLGGLPAAVCGLWLSLAKPYRTIGGVLHALLAGAVCGGFFAVLVGFSGADNRVESCGFITFFAIVGGVSAAVLGLCALPKKPPAADRLPEHR